MYSDEFGIRDIGAYDDYVSERESESDRTEGVFSPFTFLCFAIILTLFGLLTLFSSSYDTALRNGEAFYSYFLKEALVIPVAFAIGFLVCLIPLKVFRKSYFFLYAIYIALFVVYTLGIGFTSSYIFLSLFGLVGTLSILLILSDTVSGILTVEKKGVMVILTTLSVLFLLVTETLVAGTGWYVVSSIVIISSLVSERVKRSWIVYFAVALLMGLVLLTLLDERLFASFSESIMPLDNETYYSASLYASASAIAEGGIKGVGIGNGLYKLGLLEGVEGEFIYATLCEETGIFGTVVILFSSLMILIIGWRSSNRAYKKNEYYIGTFTLSSVSMLVFSFLTNMLFVSGLLPCRGVPLLLFSYNPFNEALLVILLMLLYKFIFRIGRSKE